MSEAKKKLDVIVREELRKGKISKNSEFLSEIPNVISAVEVDVAAIQKKITNNKNPLNAIFRLFGLQLVRNEYVEVAGSGSKTLKTMVTIDEAMMKDIVAKYAEMLVQAEEAGRTRESNLTSSVNDLNVEIDSLRKELSQTRSNAASLKNNLAVSLQDVVSRLEKSSQSELVKSIEELIEDLGYKVNWTLDSADDKRFHFQTVTQLKREGELLLAKGFDNIFISKPSLVSSDGDEVKGFAYVLRRTEG